MMEIYRALRAMLAHIMAGSDHAAPLSVRLANDAFHLMTGVVAGLSGWAGALYLFIGLRKQDADGEEPRAKRDSWIDKAAIIEGVALGWALLAWLGVLAGWLAVAVFCVAWSVVLICVMALKAHWRRDRG